MLHQHIERPAPLRQAVYDAIAGLIITRSIEPGEHLVENELATDLGVSRQPVREALQRLQSEGWVDLRPGQGAFVHIPTAEEADQLLAVRCLLETESARLAAARSSAGDVAELRSLQRKGERAVADRDAERMVLANADLHARIVAMSGNTVLAEHIAVVERRVRWYYAPIARSRGDQAWAEHAAIIDVIEAGNAAGAADLMRQHTERTRTAYARQQGFHS